MNGLLRKQNCPILKGVTQLSLGRAQPAAKVFFPRTIERGIDESPYLFIRRRAQTMHIQLFQILF